MCGICGTIVPGRDGAPLTEKMLAAILHRGPDGHDTWSAPGLCLGHARLAILDLSHSGKQPMMRGPLTIIFNGEIFNHEQLREELRSSYGQSFSTATDTEVLLAAWESWGLEKTLERLRGMWALAVHDARTGKLTLSRDRFGIKPLYYYRGKDFFLFASEIKALLACEQVPRRACLPILSDLLVAGLLDHRPETCFRDILQLQPGHTLELDCATLQERSVRRYDLAARVKGRSATVEEFGSVFRTAVRQHLRSDVPVGMYLSGGLDSSCIAAEAAKNRLHDPNLRLLAITAQSGDSRNDETAYARAVTQQCGLDWKLATPSARDFREHWERCLWHQEEPTTGNSVFMQYWVMKTASENGLKVMLDGQGADECLLGYERYYPALFFEWARRGQLGRAASEFFAAGRNSKLTLRQLFLYQAYFLFSGPRKLRLGRRFPSFPPELLKQTFAILDELTASFRSVSTMQTEEITRFQLPHLLKYADRNSMAWSIEDRVPFLDHEVVETALALKPEDKVRDGYTKWALRKTMQASLPESIIWRKSKIGFEAPARVWTERDVRWSSEVLRQSPILQELGCANYNGSEEKLLLPLINVAQWERMYKVTL